jgi:hypothetical protein
MKSELLRAKLRGEVSQADYAQANAKFGAEISILTEKIALTNTEADATEQLVSGVWQQSWRWAFARFLPLTGPSREFSTIVLIKFLLCLGWIRVRQYPTAGGTSPSRKGAVLQPDHLPSHGWTLSHRLRRSAID